MHKILNIRKFIKCEILSCWMNVFILFPFITIHKNIIKILWMTTIIIASLLLRIFFAHFICLILFFFLLFLHSFQVPITIFFYYDFFVAFLIPLTLIITLNTVTAYTVWKLARVRRTMTNHKRYDYSYSIT